MSQHIITITHYLTVPPRWRLEPNDMAVAAGQDVTLQCQADGYPKPSITWKKAVGKININLKISRIVISNQKADKL